jgi:hypothetical protein
VADVDVLRGIAMGLPEVEEQDHFGRPSFRVRDKIFATVLAGTGDGAHTNLKLPREEHEALVASRPEVFGTVVWGQLIRTSVLLAGVEADELAELVEEAWRAVAPKRVLAAFDAAAAGSEP